MDCHTKEGGGVYILYGHHCCHRLQWKKDQKEWKKKEKMVVAPGDSQRQSQVESSWMAGWRRSWERIGQRREGGREGENLQKNGTQGA